MGERVWRYTVKGFEMPPLCDEMPPFQMLSPARDISFHPQATSLSSTGDHPFTRGIHVLCYRRNQIGTRQGQFAAQGLCALQLEVGRVGRVRRVGLFQALELA